MCENSTAARDSSSPAARSSLSRLRAAKDLAADRDRPFASRKVTRGACSTCQGLFFTLNLALTKYPGYPQVPQRSEAERVSILRAHRRFIGLFCWLFRYPDEFMKPHYRPLRYPSLRSFSYNFFHTPPTHTLEPHLYTHMMVVSRSLRLPSER